MCFKTAENEFEQNVFLRLFEENIQDNFSSECFVKYQCSKKVMSLKGYEKIILTNFWEYATWAQCFKTFLRP